MAYSCSSSVTEVATCHCFPGVEELRMVRALTHTALLEARQHGVYRAAYRGFRIEAVRWSVPPGYGVGVGVTCVGAPHARSVMVVIDHARDYRVWIVAERRAPDEAGLWESIAMARVL